MRAQAEAGAAVANNASASGGVDGATAVAPTKRGSGSSKGRKGATAARASATGHPSGASGSSVGSASAKRRLNGYQLFAKLSRAGVVAANPGAQPKEVMGLVAAAWRSLGGEEQAQWQERAGQQTDD
jgi:hypothetical protein